MRGVVPRSGLLGRGVPTHPPHHLPRAQNAGDLLTVVLLATHRVQRQAARPPPLRHADVYAVMPRVALLAATGAALALKEAEETAGKMRAIASRGCAHLHGCICHTSGAEEGQISGAQPRNGQLAAIRTRAMKPVYAAMRRIDRATLTANQFEGARSRLGRGGSATASQRGQFEGALTRLGMRGQEAPSRRRWRATSPTSTWSGPPRGRDTLTTLTEPPNHPPRRGSRRSVRGSRRAHAAATLRLPLPLPRRHRERSWAIRTLQRPLNRQLKTQKFTRTCSGRTTEAATRRRRGDRQLLPPPLPRTRLGTRPGPTPQRRELGLSS
jgi:hypothetical protein